MNRATRAAAGTMWRQVLRRRRDARQDRRAYTLIMVPGPSYVHQFAELLADADVVDIGLMVGRAFGAKPVSRNS